MSMPDGGVHVDWYMTAGEWRQLYTDLWQHTDTPYIARLIEAGKVPAPPWWGRDCRICGGGGMLTVPDIGGESASQEPCPDPIHSADPVSLGQPF
jgi:hypothetical protein